MSTGWWFGTWLLWLSIQLGISSSQLTKSYIFQMEWNHQPDNVNIYIYDLGNYYWLLMAINDHDCNGYLWVTFFDLTTWPWLRVPWLRINPSDLSAIQKLTLDTWHFGMRSVIYSDILSGILFGICSGSLLASILTSYLIFYLACGRVRACPDCRGACHRFRAVCPDCRGARHALLALAVRSGAQGGKYLSEEVREWVSCTEGGLAFSTLIKSRDLHLAGGEKQNKKKQNQEQTKNQSRKQLLQDLIAHWKCCNFIVSRSLSYCSLWRPLSNDVKIVLIFPAT